MLKLNRLLQSHEFLQRALKDYGPALGAKEQKKLRREAEKAFSELVHYPSSDPRVTLAQVELLMSALPQHPSDSDEAQALRDVCLESVKRLAAEAAKLVEPRGGQKLRGNSSSIVLPAHELQLLDSQSDRISIFDRDYRYKFTNKANAAFHGRKSADFVGMPSQVLVGTKCFVELTKPSVDACFAGRTLKFPVSLTRGKKMLVYAATVEPVRNGHDQVVAAMVITRDVTNYGIAAEKIWPAMDE